MERQPEAPPIPPLQHHRLQLLDPGHVCVKSPDHLTAGGRLRPPSDPSLPPPSPVRSGPVGTFFPPSVMLQIGDEAVCFSAVFLLVMLTTRRASAASLLTAFLYVFVAMFRFPPVPADQARRVLRPGAASGGVPVLAHRGGSHDAPENTLAAIREVFHKDVNCRDKSSDVLRLITELVHEGQTLKLSSPLVMCISSQYFPS